MRTLLNRKKKKTCSPKERQYITEGYGLLSLLVLCEDHGIQYELK